MSQVICGGQRKKALFDPFLRWNDQTSRPIGWGGNRKNADLGQG